jgi:hypothetical protein
MLEVDAFLAVVFLVVVGAVLYAALQRGGRGALPSSAAATPPSTELARAVRLLDRILAVDEAFPQLPTELRDEAKRITASFYRELDE